LSFHNHILTHQNKAINKTWAYTSCIQSIFKHFKTIIMAFKVINDFRWCTTNFVNNNLKRQKKRRGCAHWASPPHQSLKVYLAMRKLIHSLDSLLLSSWFLVSFISHIGLDSSLFILKHNICYLSFFFILIILLIFFFVFSFFFFLLMIFSVIFSYPLLVCSRITFYKLNKTINGKTMVVLPIVC
jgi:hypothetical protein